MKAVLKKVNILYLLLLLFYLSTAIISLIFCKKSLQEIADNSFIIGLLILLSSIPHLLIFVIQGGLNKKEKIPYAIFGFIGFLLGLYFSLTKRVTLDEICLVWGVFDVTKSIFEIIDVAPEVIKERKYFEIIEVVISAVSIFRAALLAMEKFEGINVHLIFLGVSFLVYFIKNLLTFLVEKKHD